MGIVGRQITDFTSARNNLYEGTKQATAEIPPYETPTHLVRLANVDYDPNDNEDEQPERFDYTAQKNAVYEKDTLGRRLRGTWQMVNKETGQVEQEQRRLLAVVPRVNEDGTVIYRGSRYSVQNQQRVKPATFARLKKNEELEVFCFHRSVPIWTEIGMIPIGQIVKRRMNVKVWSYDFQTGQFVLRPITGWFRNKVRTQLGRAVFDAPGRLPSLFDRHHPNVLWSTPEHKVLDSFGDKTPIADASSFLMVEEQPTETQRQVLLGSLLGDGYISPDGIFEEAHGLSQHDYLVFKSHILDPFVKSPVQTVVTTHKKQLPKSKRSGPRVQKYSRFTTKACAFLYRLRDLCYPDGVKRVTREWLDQLDDRGLAIWFGDDGSSYRAKNQHGRMNTTVVTLATHGFSTAEVDLIIDWLYERWGVKASRSSNHKERKGRDCLWAVNMYAEEADKFLDLVAPYVHPSVAYKMPHRPIVKQCVGCGKEIGRRFKRCNACASSLSEPKRSRSGRVALQQLLRTGQLPTDLSPGLRWDARMTRLGSEVGSMLADIQPVLGLHPTRYEYRQNEGLHFEKCSVAYDIEVDGTHNYFANGVLVSNCNVKPGTGSSHRYILNPETGVFLLNTGHSRVPLAPILKMLGADDAKLQEAWGPELAKANLEKRDKQALQKVYARLVPKKYQMKNPDEQMMQLALQETFKRMQVDPWSMKRTTGIETDRIDADTILAATKKVLQMSRGESAGDDRDHLAFQTYHTIEDLFPERIRLDKNRIQKQLIAKAMRRGGVSAIPPKALQPQIEAAIFSSGMAVQPEMANPLDSFDRATRLTKMGEGGMSSTDSVPMESRDVHASQYGFVDPARTVESLRTGIDVNLASQTFRGEDGRLYTPVINARTGQKEMKTPEDLLDANLAVSDRASGIPGLAEVTRKSGGGEDYAFPDEVDYVLPDFEQSAFSPLSNLIALKSAGAQNRLAMGARFIAQSLPLKNREAPLVQQSVPGTNRLISTNMAMADRVGAVFAQHEGVVTDIGPSGIKIKTAEGEKRIPIHNWTPLGSKTGLHNTPVVQVGSRVAPGQLLAKSNFTDNSGALALGLNARVALMPWGDNYEDAITVSQSFAKRMTSEHLYRHRLSPLPEQRVKRNEFVSVLPSAYNKSQLEKLDDTGVIQVGQAVRKGDPLVLAATPKVSANLRKRQTKSFSDDSVTWDHDDDGIVQEVHRARNGDVVVAVGSTSALKGSDKISDLYGAKGIVRILPDERMLHDENGNPFDAVASDLGVISRQNPNRPHEILLGKIAAMRGQPYILDDFTGENIDEFVEQELKKYNVKDRETVVDPRNGRQIPGVLTGVAHLVKLHHLSESKAHARGMGKYSSDGTPAKGSDEDAQAKRLSNQELGALVAHGANSFIRESALLRGQNDPEFQARYMTGMDLPAMKVPFVYNKMLAYMKASGINPVKEGSKTSLMLMADKDVMDLAGSREIRSGETVDLNKDMKPIKGGLFDENIFGGDGNQWARYQLSEPMPHPLMEDVFRKLMGVTKDQYRNIYAGKQEFKEFGTGPKAIAGWLKNIDVDREIQLARKAVDDSRKTKREEAVVRLRYLRGLSDRKIDPKSLMLTQVPILPPVMRPVSRLAGKDTPLIDGMNLLYRDMVEADKNLNSVKGFSSDVSNERLALYDSIQAAVGLREPVDPELRSKQVTGLVKRMVGKGGAKTSFVQRKLLSGTVDMVGRAVIGPSHKIGMDEIGVPEEQAWKLYSMPIIRALRRDGMPIVKAKQLVDSRDPMARLKMEEVMASLPVIASRAPVLHKFGIMAFKPKLVDGHSLLMSPLVYSPFGADNDGDAMNFHAVMGEDAAKDALEKMLPSKNLFSPRDFKSVNYAPGQDHALGLYLASHMEPEKNARPQVFRSLADAAKAFERGEITINTPITVLN